MFTECILVVVKIFTYFYIFIHMKFVPIANKIDQEKLTTETEEYRRKLRLLWHFRNYVKSFVNVRFRPKFYSIRETMTLL